MLFHSSSAVFHVAFSSWWLAFLLLLLLDGSSGMVLTTSSSSSSGASSLPSSPKINNNILPLPSVRSVQLDLFTEEPKTNAAFFDDEDNGRFAVRLKRRNDIDLYGKPVTYEPDESNFANLAFCIPSSSAATTSSLLGWDATLFLLPSSSSVVVDTTGSLENNMDTTNPSPTASLLMDTKTCFVAMNRFSVKEDCSLLFEERWAARKSKLPSQDGFVSFSLLRRRRLLQEYAVCNEDERRNNHDDDEKVLVDDSFNYASCTIWASHGAWMGWRNGDGRYSHVRPEEEDGKVKRRTPVSEWMHRKASPIFWDGVVLLPHVSFD